MPQLKAISLPRLSFETYAAIAAAVMVLVGLVIQRTQSTSTSRSDAEPSIEMVLYQAEAKQLLAEAMQQSQTHGTGCYGRGAECTLARMRREAIAQLEAASVHDPTAALNAYTRLKALNAVSTLKASPENSAIAQFLNTQRRATP